jgi:hypothetical protein
MLVHSNSTFYGHYDRLCLFADLLYFIHKRRQLGRLPISEEQPSDRPGFVALSHAGFGSQDHGSVTVVHVH